MFDYRQAVAEYDKPIISHEIGQWCVYPNFEEIVKYTGVLKPKNFEIFRDFLTDNGMADQAKAFHLASGELQALCYKEEIESALRTPGFGGFQLLDLHDFPGQGTALVGVLDPFWDSKEYISPSQFNRFCSETVPLARMNKRVWVNNETFQATAEIANFGPDPFPDATVSWEIRSADKILANGHLQQTIPIGLAQGLGGISFPLDRFEKPTKLNLQISLQGTKYINDWDFWVYPEKTAVQEKKITITADMAEANRALKKGKKVLLFIPPDKVRGDERGAVKIGFSSIFWNTAWTRWQAPHTLGILCEPSHPLFKDFPTEFHTNWQWWELISASGAMILDEFPKPYRPLVQAIDSWFTNRKLGLLFEAKVELGKLMVCSIDLESNLETRPVARQMRASLMNYMNSEQFDPENKISLDLVKHLRQ